MMKKTCGTLVVQTFLADLFRSAAEAGPHDILKLYSPKGSIINISTRLEPNSPSSCYRLEVVATDCSHQPPGPLPFWPLALQCLRTADCWPSLFFHSFRGRACWGAWPFIDRKKVVNSPSSGHFLSKVYANRTHTRVSVRCTWNARDRASPCMFWSRVTGPRTNRAFIDRDLKVQPVELFHAESQHCDRSGTGIG